jgi:PAS domain S-box-containing protein
LAYIVFDQDFRVLEWNPAAESIFGYAKSEALGKNVLHLIVPVPGSDHVTETLRRIWEGDLEAHSVNENVTKDGRVINCDWFNTPIWDTNGKVTSVISLGQDVTAQICPEKRFDYNCPLHDPSCRGYRIAESDRGTTRRTEAENALRYSADWLRHLSQRVREVQDKDRQNLSSQFQNEIGQLRLAIIAVSQSEPYVMSAASKAVIASYLALHEPSLDRLTRRQREVLQLVVEGFKSKQIAKKLEISIKTVEMHRGHTMVALDIHDIPGLVRYAIRAGLISANTEANN